MEYLRVSFKQHTISHIILAWLVLLLVLRYLSQAALRRPLCFTKWFTTC
ncbi:protein of unknown function [Xenorhabdus doucetiae]|uniref:Uncharacterized protein n=1 Tax=Xenorhabdus doucetiae TaxID=351671 RepID=A0A068QMR1_9GAMM|nr:protein of unknown function [Xenorhabdus doucetiae]